ncbi:MAG: methyltransferase domain-containing protein, partial [Zoogloea sp.]|nr:methyltransferase domain-containing protein [Zoogloea sp.]
MTDAPAPKRAVRAAFDKAADAYDAVAAVQRSACDRLLALVSAQALQPRRIVDAGCGTGYALAGLHRRFPDANLIALDFAPAMLRRHAPGLALPLCADLERLPLADASIDALWSSYALQWCHPRKALPELARSLRPGGQLWIATLGPGTL